MGVMEMADVSLDTIVSLIGEMGFPMIITAYLLLRFERKIEKLSEAIQELKNSIK